MAAAIVTKKQADIIALLVGLRTSTKAAGRVRVNVSKNQNKITLSYDNRKYIGRMEMRWDGDQFVVHMADKTEGKIINSDYPGAKGAYFLIGSRLDARKFVKMYELMTQLAALGRTR